MPDLAVSGSLLVGPPKPAPSDPRYIDVNDQQLATLLVASEPSMARQSHGFVFQSGVSRLLGLYVPADYIDEVDAYSIDPPDDEVMRHSFKNMKEGTSVELGDLVRNAQVSRDFVMYVGFWRSFKTDIRSIYVMHVPAERWRSLFPADIAPFTALSAFSGISNSHDDDDNWAVRLNELKQAWSASLPAGSPVTINFKRDHKKQRRVQCGISSVGFPNLFAELYDSHRTDRLDAALSGRRGSNS